jgi:hypothetical protein
VDFVLVEKIVLGMAAIAGLIYMVKLGINALYEDDSTYKGEDYPLKRGAVANSGEHPSKKVNWVLDLLVVAAICVVVIVSWAKGDSPIIRD